jgi:hypothetical protein
MILLSQDGTLGVSRGYATLWRTATLTVINSQGSDPVTCVRSVLPFSRALERICPVIGMRRPQYSYSIINNQSVVVDTTTRKVVHTW